MEYTYDMIQPLIVSAELEGNTMFCEFQTPEGQIIESQARIKRVKSIQSDVERNVKRIMVNQARRSASRFLRSALGGGMLGRTGSSVIRSMTQADNLGMKYSGEEKNAAVVDAFQRVAEHFQFDAQSNSWVTSKATTAPVAPKVKEEDLSGFEQHFLKNPLNNNFEKEILARILVEIANADGNISQEEKDFLGSFIPPGVGNIGDLLLMDPVSPLECKELSEGAKESIYRTAWVLSLIDNDLDASEEGILMEYAELFGLSSQATNAAIKDAKVYVLENSIDIDIKREELFEIADQIGLSREDAEMSLIQLKKRS